MGELRRVSLGNLLWYVERDICRECVHELRGLASDLELGLHETPRGWATPYSTSGSRGERGKSAVAA